MSGWCPCRQLLAQRQDLELGESSTVEFFLPRLQGVLAADGSQTDPALETAFSQESSLIQVMPFPGAAYIQ